MSSALTSSSPQPANDHCWLASAPTTHGPSMKRPTAVGPALHLPVPSCESLAVGNVMVGPTPQMSFSLFAGDRKTARIDVAHADGAGDRRGKATAG